MKRSLVLLFVALVAGAALSVTPALGGGVVHKVSVGGADVAPPPGTDANFSLSGVEHADGTVTGQWQDTFFGRGTPAASFHMSIDCLLVVGNEAWVSGVITHAPDFPGAVGLPAITRVRDNGTSANDPADQISFTWIGLPFTCNDAPDLPLFDLITGQAKVS
jgi:hypothetical protein